MFEIGELVINVNSKELGVIEDIDFDGADYLVCHGEIENHKDLTWVKGESLKKYHLAKERNVENNIGKQVGSTLRKLFEKLEGDDNLKKNNKNISENYINFMECLNEAREEIKKMKNTLKINDKVDINFAACRYVNGKIIKEYSNGVYDVELNTLNKTVIPVDKTFLTPHKEVKSFPSDFKEVKESGVLGFDKTNEMLKEIQDGKIDFYQKSSKLIFKKGDRAFVVDGYWEVEL